MQQPKDSSKKTKRGLGYWIMVVVWMMVIFTMSTSVGSPRHSESLTTRFLRWINPHITKRQIHKIDFIERKIGHVTEYAVLAALLWKAMAQVRPDESKTWCWKRAGIIVAICAIYGVMDEFHQIFVVTRQPSFHDVMIDTGGACLALFLIWLSRGPSRQEKKPEQPVPVAT